MKKLLLSAVAAVSLMANDTELETLKAQMVQMQQMLKSMQEKITALETAHPSEALTAAKAEKNAEPSAVAQNVQKADSSFDLSLILDASYAYRSKREEEIAALGTPGFAKGSITDSPYNASNGFNLNYAEVGIHSIIDPHLETDFSFHLSPTALEIEEAYLTSRELPYHLRIRGGKFLSAFGQINTKHHHAWNFSDMPLIYHSFFGHEKLNEIGVQFQWIAPTEHYLMVGIEALQGDNVGSFGHAAITDPHNQTVHSSSTAEPSLMVGYLKTSADIGDTVLLAGASIAKGESRINFTDTEPAFSGKNTVYGLDLTLQHHFNHNSSLHWQSEWLYRDMDGIQFTDNGTAVTSANASKKQAGYYTELVYAPDQTWRIGTRYDSIYQNNVSENGLNQNMPDSIEKFSAMLEYHTSEFARYRLQYTRSNALFNDLYQRQNLDSLIFSINIAIGEETAHSL